MSGNRIADLRKKFAGKSDAFVPTPENQFTRIKKTKEQTARAVKIAKARAARYNMTLRALAIKTHNDQTKKEKADVAAKRKIQKDNAGYKATSRGLQVARGVTTRDRVNISKALNENVSPTVARDVIKQVAKKTHRHSKKRIPVKPIEEEEDVKTDDGIEEVKEEVKEKEPAKKSVNKVEMTGVSAALKTGDEKALNKAILSNFLSSHAPHLEEKTDELVEQFSESLGLLFQTLLKKYPNEVETEKSGEQKADKEIADAVTSGDKKMPENADVEAENDTDDEDSSLIFDETAIEEEEEVVVKPELMAEPPKTSIEEIKIEEIDEDDSSLVEVQDENFQRGYEKTLKKAEKSDAGVLKSLARRRTTLKLTQELAKEVDEYKKELEEEGEDDSLIETPAVEEGAVEDIDEDDSLIETPYIVNLEETKPEEEDAPVKWAVQFQNNTKKLKAKLLKQGLTEDQVEQLVENLDQNTSEML